MNDRLKGDIDLTQNLDFYRKKPPMLLPKNVNLSDINKGKINVDNPTNTYINISYNDNIIYNMDFSSLYDSNMIVYNYQNNRSFSETTTSTSTTLYYQYDNNHQFRFNTFDRNSIITSMNISFGTKSYSTIKEKIIKIWDHITKSEPKSVKTVCSQCGKVILNPTAYKYNQCCKSCGSKKDIKFGRFSFSGFKFYHRDRDDNYEYYDDIPWDNCFELEKSLWSYYNKRSGRVQIPWLQKLSSRIYQDYIEDLHEEKDYSSYLTNMGWLGIHE